MFRKHKKHKANRLPFNPEKIEEIVRNETAPTPNLVLRLENGKTYTIYYGSLLSLNQDYNFFSDIADTKKQQTPT